MTTVVPRVRDVRVPVPVFLGAIALLIALAAVTGAAREERYPAVNTNVANYLDVRSGAVLQRLTLSFNALAADVYWIRAIQHFGGEHAAGGSHHYDLLYPLLDLTTTLDPHFTVAYRFGAIFLSEQAPEGPGRPDLAIALLEKGIAADPARWEYFEDTGFVYYWRLHDYVQAARWWDRGGQLSGAPWWLRNLAAVTLARGGDRAASRFMWQQIYQSADNDWLREQARQRLLQLDALDQIDRLQRIVSSYRQRSAQGPLTWSALERSGVVRGTPLDPTGRPYALDPETGAVSLDPSSPLNPLPTEPPKNGVGKNFRSEPGPNANSAGTGVGAPK